MYVFAGSIARLRAVDPVNAYIKHYEATDTARTAVTIGESPGAGDTPQPSQVEVIEGTPAADTDGDGFLDDINGNGEVDRGDAQALFAALGREVLADNADVLDRNGNGAVDRGDVQAVFQAATS